MAKTIFTVQYEVNDKNMGAGYHFFTKLEDAVKHMRRCVAKMIWYYRNEGCKVEFFKVFKDSPIGVFNGDSQSICFRVTTKDKEYLYHEYRIYGYDLHDELPELSVVQP